MIINFCYEWLQLREKLPKHVREAIENFTLKVLRKYSDAEIYLFGSYARNDWLEDSDIDIIVVSNYLKDVDWIERSGLLRQLASFELPFEILVYTKDELLEKLKGINIVSEASRYWIKINC